MPSFFYKISLFIQSTKKYFIAIGCLIVLLSLFKIVAYSFFDTPSDAAYDDYFKASYKVFSIRIPKNLNFSGEEVPTMDFSVHESMERELIINTYWESQSLLLQKRANRWFPIIEPILKRNNIPDDFKYIALIESQLSNVVSPQGATGFWQIIESTGINYGLEITEDVDERYNVEKSTEAACKYFNESFKTFKNWTLVAASYNLGIGGVQAQMNKQKVDSYYDLALTDETARYLYRILAMKEIISRPKVYGYMLRKKDLYPPLITKKITIDSNINDLADFAILQKVNYKILKLFNPWLRTNKLNNDQKKKYTIEIPKGSMNIYDMDGNYDGSDILNTKDSFNLVIPAQQANDSAKKEEKLKE